MSFKHNSRIILGAVFGNLIESFDMAICGLLSVYLAKYLMGDMSMGLLVIFVTFFAGYLVRPIGAFFLGLFSDVYGRKITLAASIIAMGSATAGIGIIPGNSHIGHYSVMLLLVFRVVQSFFCGVEYLNSTAYLVENAKENEKGFSGSWSSFGSTAGLLIASIVAFFMANIIAKNAHYEWLIWRAPFLLALLGSSIGLYIRVYLPESLEYIIYYSEKPKPKIATLLKSSIEYCANHKLKTIYVFILSCLGVTATFLFYIYGPTQAHILAGFSENDIMISNIISLSVLLITYPAAGKLTDKINKQKLIIASSIGLLLGSYVYFFALSAGNYKYYLLTQLLLSLPSGIYYATVPVLLTSMFPLQMRCTALSVIYSIAASLSAGLTPLFALVLIKKTQLANSPWLLIGALESLLLIIMLVNNYKKTASNFFLKPWFQ